MAYARTTRELFGVWTAESVSCEGRLIISPDNSSRLQLTGSGLPGTASTIVGQLDNGQAVTLFGAKQTQWSFGSRWQSEWRIGLVVLGFEIESDDESCLTTVSAQISGLTHAVGTSGLTYEAAESATAVRVSWGQVDDIEVELSDCRLVISSTVAPHKDGEFKLALEHKARVEIRANSAMSLNEAHARLTTLGTLVAFATEAQVSTASFVALRPGPRFELAGEVLFKERPRYGPLPGDKPAWLLVGELQDPSAAVAGFFRFADEFRAATLILHEYMLYLSELNPADELLYLARFLEVYHRTRSPGNRDPAHVHAERVGLVKTAAGAKHKDWASQVTYMSNELTFKERVRAVISGPGRVAAPALGMSPEDFARVLGNTRNYWTHYAPDLETKALRDVELSQFDDRVLLLVRACVLHEIGVHEDEAEAMLSRDWRWEVYAESDGQAPFPG